MVDAAHLNQVAQVVKQVSGVNPNIDQAIRSISAPVTTGSKALIEAAKLLDDAQIHPLDIGLKRPSLDDVFLALTGHVAEEKSDDATENSEIVRKDGKRNRRGRGDRK